jgi:hypothetical protein
MFPSLTTIGVRKSEKAVNTDLYFVAAYQLMHKAIATP